MRSFLRSTAGRAVLALTLLAISLGSIYGMYSVLGITSGNAMVYLVEDAGGSYRIRSYHDAAETDRLVYMFDATAVFKAMQRFVSRLINRPVVEVTWNEETGQGVVKQFRPDGTEFLLVLSRFFLEGKRPHGVIVGGDLAPGDADADGAADGSNTGMAFHDGDRWIHLWCTANEGIAPAGGGKVQPTYEWDYLSSRVLRKSYDEAVIESEHEVRLDGVPVGIRRRLHLRGGDDFFTLTIEFTNRGDQAVSYDYAYGDEPWVGRFGSSEGDVGWFEGGMVTREQTIDPRRHRVVGFADVGNPEFGERGLFTGFANFIEWLEGSPTQVYFSNDFYTIRDRMLDSRESRVVNIVWKDQVLMPGKSSRKVLKIGFIPPGSALIGGLRGAAAGNPKD